LINLLRFYLTDDGNSQILYRVNTGVKKINKHFIDAFELVFKVCIGQCDKSLRNYY